jgi:hypothetical protein
MSNKERSNPERYDSDIDHNLVGEIAHDPYLVWVMRKVRSGEPLEFADQPDRTADFWNSKIDEHVIGKYSEASESVIMLAKLEAGATIDQEEAASGEA